MLELYAAETETVAEPLTAGLKAANGSAESLWGRWGQGGIGVSEERGRNLGETRKSWTHSQRLVHLGLL
jgi:hypothetical protein